MGKGGGNCSSSETERLQKENDRADKEHADKERAERERVANRVVEEAMGQCSEKDVSVVGQTQTIQEQQNNEMFSSAAAGNLTELIRCAQHQQPSRLATARDATNRSLLHAACAGGDLGCIQWVVRRAPELLADDLPQANSENTEWMHRFAAARQQNSGRKAAVIVLGGPLRPGDSARSPQCSIDHPTPLPKLATLSEQQRTQVLSQMNETEKISACSELPGLWMEHRLIEGLRLYDECGGQSHLIFTGADCDTCSPIVEADVMQDWAQMKGIHKRQIITDRDAKNTVENAWFTSRMLVESDLTDVTIVTSRFHIPRAKACYEPIMAAHGHATNVVFIEAFDTYNDAAFQQRMALEHQFIGLFDRDVEVAKALILQSGGDLSKLQADLYSN